ncbi:MAG: 4-(cytidine 5'-diphospho)-2-C-methyl-D-erythritol kinase, partial [Halochromatium sp.]
ELAPEAVDGLVVNTCTGYLCPGLSSYVAEDLGLRTDLRVLDLMGMGCGGAVPNWEAATGLLARSQCGPVLSIAVEVCTATIFMGPEPDLVVRAARALQAETGCDAGVSIRVDKRLPMGGGLGGGSSDAATTLHALNRLWGTALATDRLAELGLQLGADVPVFVRGEAAWGEGVGESLDPVELATPWYLVLVPRCQVSTAAVFGDPGLTRGSAPITLADFLRGNADNDCLATVLANYPVVASAYRWLAERAEAKLTGTGACLFAALPDRAAAERLRGEVPPELPAFVARGRNRSPLFASPRDEDANS